jgi:hypothetical protein
MRLPRVRFTVRRLMAVVAVVALALWGYSRYLCEITVKTYDVEVLVDDPTPVGKTAGLAALAARMRSSVTPDCWWLTASVTLSATSCALDVRHTEEGHEQVQGWLNRKKCAPVLARLEQPVRLSHPEGGRLLDVLNDVTTATKGPGLRDGVPFLIDPVGYEFAGLTPETVLRLDGGEVPLRVSLGAALGRLRLRYVVDEGLVLITR